MKIFDFLIGKRKGISYGITVCNEKAELKRLLDCLIPHLDKNDEIIVLQDIMNEDLEITHLISSYGDRVVHLQDRLEGDFSKFKNKLIKSAKGYYLFQIDADEVPAESLLVGIKSILRENKRFDCFLVPRINIVRGITEDWLKKWNWTQNKDGYINYPDYQMRLFRVRGTTIHWENKVHETLVGFKRLKELPMDTYDYCLFHDKNIDNQIMQNKFYDKNF